MLELRNALMLRACVMIPSLPLRPCRVCGCAIPSVRGLTTKLDSTADTHFQDHLKEWVLFKYLTNILLEPPKRRALSRATKEEGPVTVHGPPKRRARISKMLHTTSVDCELLSIS